MNYYETFVQSQLRFTSLNSIVNHAIMIPDLSHIYKQNRYFKDSASPFAGMEFIVNQIRTDQFVGVNHDQNSE